jgi:hypothetical protein
MDESSDRPIARRAAYSHLQQVCSSMQRSERLAISLALINSGLQGDDKVTVDLSVQGSNTFNEKLADIQVLAKQFPRKILVELAFDILCVELHT